MSSRKASGSSTAACTGSREALADLARAPAARSLSLRRDEIGDPDRARPRAAASTARAGERIAADAVVVQCRCGGARAADCSAHARARRRVADLRRAERSLSAVTWSVRRRGPSASRSLRHNVFFSGDYAAEFDDIFRRRHACRASRRSMSAPRIATKAVGTPTPRSSGCCASSTRRRGRPRPLARPEIERCENDIRRRWRAAACTMRPPPERRDDDDAERFRPTCSRPRAGRSTAAPRTAGRRRFSVRARAPGFRASTWRGQHASGAGGADGGAVGPAGGSEPARGPDSSASFDRAIARRLCVVVCRRPERRRPARPDDHRLRRQRLLALLRLGRRRVGPGQIRSTTARSTSRCTASTGDAGP